MNKLVTQDTRSERRITVAVPAGSPSTYDVVVGSGLLAGIGDRLACLSAGAAWGVISDAHVQGLVGESVVAALEAAGCRAVPLVFPAGEQFKTRGTVSDLQNGAIEAGLGRDAWILTVGGGVVGDVGGFVAATLFRGLPMAQVPTSLLAMVDSSVGGKTGVDTPAGKNLVGAFHQPRWVLADVDTLATLPDAELRAGLAEVIKYGVILDQQLFIDLEDGLLESCAARVPEALISVIERCVAIKARVVADDERETNWRQVLNFGHTIGHAVEMLSKYSMRHGEAVAIGMICEAHLAQRLVGAPPDTPVRIRDLCSRAGLPTEIPAGLTPDAMLEAARRDKKTRANQIRCALPRQIGAMAHHDGQWAVEVPDSELIAAIEAN